MSDADGMIDSILNGLLNYGTEYPGSRKRKGGRRRRRKASEELVKLIEAEQREIDRKESNDEREA